ncbi:MAG: hypothetical protein LBC63_06145 [Holophagales bacterium]|jgi:hypothetical protein|nr:hypothetical protein [Holophagales bacterium]
MVRAALVFFCAFNFLAADGLSDLKAALKRYEAKTTIRGTIEAQTWNTQGKDKDASETKGRASAQIEYGPSGLKMLWDRQFMQQLDMEARERATAKDNPPQNQALNAVWAIDMRSVSNLLNPVESLSRFLETATLLGESRETRNGAKVRTLSFSTPAPSGANRFRRWLKDFSATIKIWIADDGSPLGYWQKVQLKGRAFLVISLEQNTEETIAYSNVAGHLVCTRQEEKQEFSGGGEYFSSRTIKVFRPVAN